MKRIVLVFLLPLILACGNDNDSSIIPQDGEAVLVWTQESLSVCGVDTATVCIVGTLENRSLYAATNIGYQLSYERTLPSGNIQARLETHDFSPRELPGGATLAIDGEYLADWELNWSVGNIEISFFWE